MAKQKVAKKKAVSSFAIILQVSRRLWQEFVRHDGALDEPAHRDDVLRIVRADGDFVRLRAGEEWKRLIKDHQEAVRRIRHESKPPAKQILERDQAGASGQAVQMTLPMQEFAKEKYEIPITGETKAGPDLLLVEAEACAQEYLMRAAELNVKAQRLLWVLREAKRKGLAESDRLAKVWA